MYRALKKTTSAPSGIAQLRNSVDHSNIQHPEPMNLDDFILPNSVASPAGITPPPSDEALASSNVGPSGIAIKTKKDQSKDTSTHPPIASVPNFAQDSNRSNEFSYVQRRVRKTSVDERRVGSHHPCILIFANQANAISNRLERDLLISLPKFLPLPMSHWRIMKARSIRRCQITL